MFGKKRDTFDEILREINPIVEEQTEKIIKGVADRNAKIIESMNESKEKGFSLRGSIDSYKYADILHVNKNQLDKSVDVGKNIKDEMISIPIPNIVGIQVISNPDTQELCAMEYQFIDMLTYADSSSSPSRAKNLYGFIFTDRLAFNDKNLYYNALEPIRAKLLAWCNNSTAEIESMLETTVDDGCYFMSRNVVYDGIVTARVINNILPISPSELIIKTDYCVDYSIFYNYYNQAHLISSLHHVWKHCEL